MYNAKEMMEKHNRTRRKIKIGKELFDSSANLTSLLLDYVDIYPELLENIEETADIFGNYVVKNITRHLLTEIKEEREEESAC